MLKFVKNYFKIGMVVGPLSLWTDCVTDKENNFAKIVRNSDITEENDPESKLVCKITNVIVPVLTTIIIWPTMVFYSLCQIFLD